MLAKILGIGFATIAPAIAQANCIGLLLPGPEASVAPLVAQFRTALVARAWDAAQAPLFTVYAAAGADAAEAVAAMPANCSVLVGASLREVRAIRERFPDRPTVMIAVGDPIGAGLAQSFHHPGGRITGLSDFRPEYAEERLALARDLMPWLRRLGFIHNPDAPTARLTFEAAARHGVEITPLVARSSIDLKARLEELPEVAIEAVLVVPYPLTFENREAIAEAASKRRLPVIFGYAEFMDLPAPAAAIASLGADLGDLYRRAAGYVAELLAGADPATLPIGRPEKQELVLNAAVATQLGIALPDSLRARATRILR